MFREKDDIHYQLSSIRAQEKKFISGYSKTLFIFVKLLLVHNGEFLIISTISSGVEKRKGIGLFLLCICQFRF